MRPQGQELEVKLEGVEGREGTAAAPEWGMWEGWREGPELDTLGAGEG